MKNLTVRKQLGLAFGLMASLVLLVAFLSLHSLSKMNQRFVHHIEEIATREAVAIDIRSAANRRALAVRNLVLVTREEDLAMERADVAKAHEDVQARIAKLKQLTADPHLASDHDRAMVAEIEKVESAYGPVALDIVRLATSGQREGAIAKIDKDCRPLIVSLQKATKAYAEFLREEGRRSAAAGTAEYAFQRVVVLVASTFAVVVAVFLGWLITTRLVRALGAEPMATSGLFLEEMRHRTAACSRRWRLCKAT
jgi:methyl-accepting chemotaxis protein